MAVVGAGVKSGAGRRAGQGPRLPYSRQAFAGDLCLLAYALARTRPARVIKLADSWHKASGAGRAALATELLLAARDEYPRWPAQAWTRSP